LGGVSDLLPPPTRLRTPKRKEKREIPRFAVLPRQAWRKNPYKACSLLLQDFYNLVDVYLDAVLHPKCIEDERTFAQEGWHYELEDAKVSCHALFHDLPLFLFFSYPENLFLPLLFRILVISDLIFSPVSHYFCFWFRLSAFAVLVGRGGDPIVLLSRLLYPSPPLPLLLR